MQRVLSSRVESAVKTSVEEERRRRRRRRVSFLLSPWRHPSDCEINNTQFCGSVGRGPYRSWAEGSSIRACLEVSRRNRSFQSGVGAK